MLLYKVLAANDYEEFERAMAYNLDHGWKPQGGISITHVCTEDKSFLIYAQAVIKSERQLKVEDDAH